MVPSLIPGPYTAQVSANGMQSRVLEGITLNVNVNLTENVSLNVGATQQVIEVQAQALVVDRTGMTVGEVITEKTVRDAPLNGQHFVDLGGPAGEPQGRGDTLGVLSDTVSFLKGNHSFRVGGEYRRFINSNFSGDTASFTFPNLKAFLNDQASSFSVTPVTRRSRVSTSAVGAYVVDSWKVRPT